MQTKKPMLAIVIGYKKKYETVEWSGHQSWLGNLVLLCYMFMNPTPMSARV